MCVAELNYDFAETALSDGPQMEFSRETRATGFVSATFERERELTGWRRLWHRILGRGTSVTDIECMSEMITFGGGDYKRKASDIIGRWCESKAGWTIKNGQVETGAQPTPYIKTNG